MKDSRWWRSANAVGKRLLLMVGNPPLGYRAPVVWKCFRNDSSGSRAMKSMRSLDHRRAPGDHLGRRSLRVTVGGPAGEGPRYEPPDAVCARRRQGAACGGDAGLGQERVVPT